MNNIGQNIAKIRKKKGYSQEKLAFLINTSVSAISRYEHGACIPPEIIIKISDIFGITTDELLCRDTVPISKNEVLIPVIKTIDINNIFSSENIKDYIHLPKQYSKYDGYLYQMPDDLFYNCGIERCSYLIISSTAPVANGNIIIYSDTSKETKAAIFNSSSGYIILSDLQGNAKIISDKSSIKIKGVVTHNIKRYK